MIGNPGQAATLAQNTSVAFAGKVWYDYVTK